MISQVVSTVDNIFVDISALEALIDRSHPDHTAATQFLHTSVARNFALMSAQQVLYSIAENLRSSRYKKLSSQIINALRQSELMHFEPLNSDDEKEAWRIFSSMQN
ncbi:hypothetical protein K8T06_11115, partial [bacterium]|nr:hypothetical protein [bacterium]